MKQLLTILCVMTAFITHAQEQQKQETKKERQQRYIEEVNPFRELGYKPKISTLSKGKYREAFPDSIVQIGNFMYNILEKRITGVTLFEELGISEATAKPEIVSRWMSPDPLSDEFPSWSPYTFTNDNPIFFTDPTGLAPQGSLDDYGFDKDGNIVLLRKTEENFDRLYAIDNSGDKKDVNNDGTVSDDDSVVVNKGVLGSKKTNTVKASNGKNYTFDQFNLTGDGKAQELFQFVSNNSNVEWSLTGTGSKEGDNGANILTTSHIENSEIGGGYLFARGYSIRFSDHSHPYSNNASTADRAFNTSLTSKFPNASTRIYHKGQYSRYESNGTLKPLKITLMPVVVNPIKL